VEPNGQIMLTYRCSAACRHCLVMSSPGQSSERTTVAHAVEYARDFEELGRRTIIAGGEAMLFPDHVLAICRALGEAGIPVAFVESNGSWCVSDELVTARLSELRESGVEGMYFSIDEYHQEFVAAERVCRGVRLAEQIFGADNVIAPKRDLEQAKALEGAAGDEELTRRRLRGGHIRYVGRAADALAPLAEPVPLEEIRKADCRADLDVDALKEVQVDPFGFVRPDMCPGVNLGNARSRRIAELARTEHVLATPLLADLAEGGPGALIGLAEEHGFEPGTAYASKCHLCFAMRRHLVAGMPDEFGPPHLYQEVA